MLLVMGEYEGLTRLPLRQCTCQPRQYHVLKWTFVRLSVLENIGWSTGYRIMHIVTNSKKILLG